LMSRMRFLSVTPPSILLPRTQAPDFTSIQTRDDGIARYPLVTRYCGKAVGSTACIRVESYHSVAYKTQPQRLVYRLLSLADTEAVDPRRPDRETSWRPPRPQPFSTGGRSHLRERSAHRLASPLGKGLACPRGFPRYPVDAVRTLVQPAHWSRHRRGPSWSRAAWTAAAVRWFVRPKRCPCPDSTSRRRRAG
jgi:hypothetical protein